MKIKLEFVTREVADDTLLVPVGKTSLDLNGMLTLNELGAKIWALLPDAEDENAIVQKILLEYDAQEDVVRADVHEFLQKLRDLGII